MLQVLRKHFKVANNLYQFNQTMIARMSRETMMYFKEVEEKGRGRFSLMIFAPVLEDFNIRQTRRVQRQGGNH